jgi:hypothetical protein
LHPKSKTHSLSRTSTHPPAVIIINGERPFIPFHLLSSPFVFSRFFSYLLLFFFSPLLSRATQDASAAAAAAFARGDHAAAAKMYGALLKAASTSDAEATRGYAVRLVVCLLRTGQVDQAATACQRLHPDTEAKMMRAVCAIIQQAAGSTAAVEAEFQRVGQSVSLFVLVQCMAHVFPSIHQSNWGLCFPDFLFFLSFSVITQLFWSVLFVFFSCFFSCVFFSFVFLSKKVWACGQFEQAATGCMTMWVLGNSPHWGERYVCCLIKAIEASEARTAAKVQHNSLFGAESNLAEQMDVRDMATTSVQNMSSFKNAEQLAGLSVLLEPGNIAARELEEACTIVRQTAGSPEAVERHFRQVWLPSSSLPSPANSSPCPKQKGEFLKLNSFFISVLDMSTI